MCVCVRSMAVGTQFSSWEAMLRDTEDEAKVIVGRGDNLCWQWVIL